MAGKETVQVAAGLITRQGKYLIAKRKAGTHLAGLWEFPGGKREVGESLEECLRRELREELGIQIVASTPFRVVRHEYPDKRVEIYFFFCSGHQEQPQALGCDDLQWVGPKDFHNYEFPPADEPLLQILNRSKRKTEGA
jgi:8-oxo-dGTP diphosphatase